MKKLLPVLLILVGLTTACANDKSTKETIVENVDTTENVVSTTTSEEQVELPTVEVLETEELTMVEKDAYILYSYSYTDALMNADKYPDSIKIEKTDTQTTYTFIEHVLSCGTHMNGEIVEVVTGDIKTLTGSFNITNNPYDIDELSLNISLNGGTGEKSGYINVNNTEIEINRF